MKTTLNNDDLDKQGVPSQEPPVDRDIRAADYHQKPLVMACFRIQMAFDTIRLTKTKTVLKTQIGTSIHDICQFWYSTALFSPVKVHQEVRKFATK